MPPQNDPQVENAMEVAVMIEEIGGEVAVITWMNPAALAAQVIALQQRLNTHIIIIGVVPRSDAPPHNIK
jgi:electron transfer flavoprotein alpha/beta subunit